METSRKGKIEKIAMALLKGKWGHLYQFGYPEKPFPTNYENDLNNTKIGLYEGSKQSSELNSGEDLIEKLLKIDVLYKEVSAELQFLLNEEAVIEYRPTARLLESFKNEFDIKSKNYNSRNNDHMAYLIDNIRHAKNLIKSKKDGV